MDTKNKCGVCESYSINSVQFYDKYICEDCISDIKAFEIDFNNPDTTDYESNVI